MNEKIKRLISLIMAVVLTISGTVLVIGATPTKEDFEVIVTTDKSSYEAGEKIHMSFEIKNNATNVEVTSVELDYIIGNDLKEYVVDFDKLPKKLSTLKAGANKIFSAQNQDDADKPVTDKPGSDKPGVDKPGENTPDAGDSSNVRLFVGILLVVAGIVVAIRMGCAKKFVALFMAVAILLGLNAVSLIQAEAATEEFYIEGSKVINYAGKERMLTVMAILTLEVEAEEGSETTDVSLTPTDIAKLLLANERLDSEKLQSDNKFISTDNIDTAFNNLRVLTLSATVNEGQYVKYSNMMDYFNSYIENIEIIIRNAGEYINYVKEDVGYDSVWLEYGAVGGYILLKVTDNEEYIFIKSDVDDYICRRYTDENGNEVYEVYKEDINSGDYQYVLCTPDKRYEFSYHAEVDPNNAEDDFDNYVVMDNSRGYWNMFTTSPVYGVDDPRYNVQNLVVGSEFAYVYDGCIYEQSNGGYKSNDYITFITPELDCDIISVYEDYIGIKLVGFDGVESFEKDENNNITSFTTANGTLINLNGRINDVVFQNGVEEYSQSPNVNLYFELCMEGEKDAYPMSSEVAAQILETLAQKGIVCKCPDDLDEILAAVDGSYAIADNFSNFYEWNGYKLTDKEAADNAVEADKEKYAILKEELKAVEDAPKGELVSGGISLEDYDFADLTVKGSDGVVFDGGKATIEGLEVEVSAADVMMAGETYEIQYALAEVTGEEGKYGTVILLDTESDGAAVYNGSSLVLNKTAEFNVPECSSAGIYTIVAYAATNEGIRVSKMVPIEFTAFPDASFTALKNGYTTVVELNDDNEAIVSYALANEYWVEFEGTEITYDAVYDLLLAEAYEKGYPDFAAVLEVYDTESGETRVATQNESLDGLVCRLAYDIPNMVEMIGYIYVELP